ncbi:MAG: tRNA uridine-5-carboxymethylaminomethyl(34) synthesis enzyme MnmG [Deltaproteobacteria bacterium]|nr:tRNA uridine-5-carboxymethylaminomethyl(34) synthesis enzyme MnmG [Deltaproteobacteria bacterium]
MRADVIVVGLGHAGIEAALAAARLGRRVAAIVPERSRIGRMSCNPAIGGSAKSQLVRELDALGGQMARAADATGIQFRRLNASRGPAVHATRVLCDRERYAAEMQRVVLGQPTLEVIEDSAIGLLREGSRVVGVRLAREGAVEGRAVVLTTGTFLSAVLHTGESTTDGGRVGEAPARGISEDLRALGLRLGRFKTGTPPRLLASTIDFERTELQPGDDPPRPLSFWTEATGFPRLRQRPCWLTHTSPRTHEVVRGSLHRSPLYQGRIEGRGPRYCPSLEDKVVRFAARERHAVFLEPEGLESPLVYPAGLSTSLPPDAQLAFLRTISGLEGVEMAQPGYAVEYDHVPATQLDRRLALGDSGLFLAGQINGTSGYEEAAVQGFWAGVNAARWASGEPAWGLARERAHLAVLVDELVTRESGEPMRMFTSLSEARLHLREGNADLRLAGEGRALGLVGDRDAGRVVARRARIDGEVARLGSTMALPDRETLAALAREGLAPFLKPVPLAELLARPEARWEALRRAIPEGAPSLELVDLEEVEAEVKYAGYARRAGREQSRVAGQLGWAIPEGFEFLGLAGLSAELQERLTRARPKTLAEASALPGVTTAALAVVGVHLARLRRGEAGCA